MKIKEVYTFENFKKLLRKNEKYEVEIRNLYKPSGIPLIGFDCTLTELRIKLLKR